MVKIIPNQRVFRTIKKKVNFVFLIGSTERAIRINSGSLIVSLPTSIISLWLLIRIFTNFLLSAVPLVNSRYNYMADKYCNFNPVAHSSLKSDHHYITIIHRSGGG